MNKTRLTIEIDNSLKHSFKVRAAERGVTLKEAIERLIEKYLEVTARD